MRADSTSLAAAAACPARIDRDLRLRGWSPLLAAMSGA
jgi:hypothetical protein